MENTTTLFETRDLMETHGVIRIENWDGDLVLWVGGKIHYRQRRGEKQGPVATERMTPALTMKLRGTQMEFFSLDQALFLATAAQNKALDAAAAIARANTSAPRIWQDGAWVNPHGEDIAQKIEALKVQA
jgi:hypothetical protein